MIINYKNREIIEEINIHDSVFEGFLYNEEEKKLLLELKNYGYSRKFKLCFYNVLILNCEMCQFWSKSPNILDWQLYEE